MELAPLARLATFAGYLAGNKDVLTVLLVKSIRFYLFPAYRIALPYMQFS